MTGEADCTGSKNREMNAREFRITGQWERGQRGTGISRTKEQNEGEEHQSCSGV